MKNFRFTMNIVIIVVLLTFLLIAILQNLNVTAVKFLIFGMNAPVISIILISLFAGFIVGILTYSLVSRKAKNKLPPADKQAPNSKK